MIQASSIHTNRFLNPTHVLGQVRFPPGIQAADFGAGTGDFALALADIIGSDGVIHAIDIQDAALSSVRSRARMAGVRNIAAVRGNLEVAGASGLPDASQDAVLLTNILFQSQRKEAIVKEAARVLRVGGMLIFVDWNKDVPFGPDRGWRLDRFAARSLIEHAGFLFESDIGAGAYHFGMTFTKT